MGQTQSTVNFTFPTMQLDTDATQIFLISISKILFQTPPACNTDFLLKHLIASIKNLSKDILQTLESSILIMVQSHIRRNQRINFLYFIVRIVEKKHWQIYGLTMFEQM